MAAVRQITHGPRSSPLCAQFVHYKYPQHRLVVILATGCCTEGGDRGHHGYVCFTRIKRHNVLIVRLLSFCFFCGSFVKKKKDSGNWPWYFNGFWNFIFRYIFKTCILERELAYPVRLYPHLAVEVNSFCMADRDSQLHSDNSAECFIEFLVNE